MACCCANGRFGRRLVNLGDPGQTNTALELLTSQQLCTFKNTQKFVCLLNFKSLSFSLHIDIFRYLCVFQKVNGLTVKISIRHKCMRVTILILCQIINNWMRKEIHIRDMFWGIFKMKLLWYVNLDERKWKGMKSALWVKAPPSRCLSLRTSCGNSLVNPTEAVTFAALWSLEHTVTVKCNSVSFNKQPGDWIKAHCFKSI